MLKQLALICAVILAITGVSYAGFMRVDNITESSGDTTIEIATSTTVYSKSFSIKSGEYFGLAYNADSADTGTINIAIDLEQSWDLPTTEGAADPDWVVPQNIATVATVTTDRQHLISLSPIPAPYARLRVYNAGTGAKGNVNLTAKLMVVEED